MARGLDAARGALRAAAIDEAPYLAPAAARRLALGFDGLAADWYWLNALQYIGRKIEEQTRAGGAEAAAGTPLDRIKAVNPQVLVRMLDMITTLDPRFTAAYEFAAVVLPAVDVQAAITLLEKGIRENPTEWYLHQQLAYIYWQRGDNLAAGDAFRRGARMTTAHWMEQMAEKIEAKGDDPQVARAMYARMYEQAQDDQVKEWARGRLMELRSLEERAVIRRVLGAFIAEQQRCPPLDPSGAPYLLVLSPIGCDVTLHPSSTVPRG
jgi:tetratricopeptide (TPR) repeat protein